MSEIQLQICVVLVGLYSENTAVDTLQRHATLVPGGVAVKLARILMRSVAWARLQVSSL